MKVNACTTKLAYVISISLSLLVIVLGAPIIAHKASCTGGRDHDSVIYKVLTWR